MTETQAPVAEILTEVVDGIGWITISNPSRANSITPGMAQQLSNAWNQLQNDSKAKVLVITGAGHRHFCAGADLNSLKTPGGVVESGQQTGLTALACGVTKPVVAAVNGPVVGLGLSFVADSDLVVASANATFSDPHVAIGRIVSYAALRLATKLPAVTATAVGLGNTRLDGRRAFELGLVNVLVETPAEIREAVSSFVQPLIDGSPTALRESLALLREMTTPAQADRVLKLAHDRVESMRDHPDAVEGPRARLEGREPRWEPV